MTITSSGIKIQKYSPNLGAIITGVDLSEEINEDQFEDIHKAFLDNQVLFFQNQNEILPEIHLKLGKLFGELHVHPAAPSLPGYPEIFEIHAHKNSKVANGEFWHSDVSCDNEPPLGTMLQLHILPETGGDTMFSDMYSAYNELSDKYKSLLDGLIAIHESEHLYSGRYEDRGVNRDNMRSVMTTVREIGQEYRSLEDKSGYKPSEEKLKTLSEAGLSDETISVVIEIIKALVVYDR